MDKGFTFLIFIPSPLAVYVLKYQEFSVLSNSDDGKCLLPVMQIWSVFEYILCLAPFLNESNKGK